MQGIGFDWDETLYAIDRRKPNYYKAMAKHGLEKCGITITDEIDKKLEAFDRQPEHHKAAQTTFAQHIFDTCGQDLSLKDKDGTPMTREKFVERFIHHYDLCRIHPDFLKEREAHLLDGAMDVLLFLRKHQIPFFIASNSPQEIVQSCVAQMIERTQQELHARDPEKYPAESLFTPEEIMELTSKRVFGDKAGLKRKPDTEMLNAGFHSIGVNPKNRGAYYIGNNFQSDILAAIKQNCRPLMFHNEAISSEESSVEKIFCLSDDIGQPGDSGEEVRPLTAIAAYAHRLAEGGTQVPRKLEIYPVEAKLHVGSINAGATENEIDSAMHAAARKALEYLPENYHSSDADKQERIITNIKEKRLEKEVDKKGDTQLFIRCKHHIPAVHDHQELLHLLQGRIQEAEMIQGRDQNGFLDRFSQFSGFDSMAFGR